MTFFSLSWMVFKHKKEIRERLYRYSSLLFPKPRLILEYISLFSQISPSFSAFSKARVYIKESSVLSCTFNRLNVGCRSLNQVQAIALNWIYMLKVHKEVVIELRTNRWSVNKTLTKDLDICKLWPKVKAIHVWNGSGTQLVLKVSTI